MAQLGTNSDQARQEFATMPGVLPLGLFLSFCRTEIRDVDSLDVPEERLGDRTRRRSEFETGRARQHIAAGCHAYHDAVERARHGRAWRQVAHTVVRSLKIDSL